jgi:uncharacterized protein YjbI with pentapeptide repeats
MSHVFIEKHNFKNNSSILESFGKKNIDEVLFKNSIFMNIDFTMFSFECCTFSNCIFENCRDIDILKESVEFVNCEVL